MFEAIKEFFAPDCTLKVGDVWESKPDDWVGGPQDIRQVVIIAFNEKEKRVRYIDRHRCIYNSKDKILQFKVPEHIKNNPHSIFKQKPEPYESEYERFFENHIKTEENFLEIEVLLGEDHVI